VSFILDALRKSDARRKTGEVPGLDSFTDRPSASRSRRRIPAWLLLAGPLCLAIVAGGVFLVQPRWLPQALVERGATDSTPTTGMTDTTESVDVGGDETPGEEPVVALADPIDDEQAVVVVDEGVARAQEDGDQPVVVDRRRVAQPASGQAVTRAAPERERVVTDPDEAMAEIERQVAETRQRQEQVQPDRRVEEQPVADREREQRRRVADTDHVADASADSSAQPEWRAQAAEYVRAWELPLSVRRSLPELKLSIHVFSPEEGGRFVLINGERYVPGDALGGGARLVDIRREGAIVDYREHRFLLEP
jgi:general secretion pathway protein B